MIQRQSARRGIYPAQQALLDKIKEVWVKYPGLRLGQLLEWGVGVPDLDNHCVFYVPDEELLVGLTKLLSETPPRGRPRRALDHH